MHNLKTERFYKPQMINGRRASADGPIKTFPLRGIKDSPPYLHDDRLLTLEDTVEFFNLVLGARRGNETRVSRQGEKPGTPSPHRGVGGVGGVGLLHQECLLPLATRPVNLSAPETASADYG
jgi:hypothetical protein